MSQLLFVFATYLLIGAAIATLVFLVLGDSASRRLDNDIFRELDCIRRQLDAIRREISDRKRP